MYQPAHFKETDPLVLAALIAGSPLATLVRQDSEGELVVDHIPLMYVAGTAGSADRLIGHVARANPLWHDGDGKPVVAVFQGAQSYISPSWYATKAETGKVVPTYNYAVVHAHGTLKAFDDPVWVHALVSRLTHRFEEKRAAPWAVSDAPEDFMAAQLRAIVGIEIAVSRMDGKWKVSQNRNAADRAGVVAGLSEKKTTLETMAELVSHHSKAP